jgi:hypothetical protein
MRYDLFTLALRLRYLKILRSRLRFLKIGCAHAALYSALLQKGKNGQKLTSSKLKAARFQSKWNLQRTISGLTLLTEDYFAYFYKFSFFRAQMSSWPVQIRPFGLKKS